MRTLILPLLATTLMWPLAAGAQNWTDMGGFPDDTTFTAAMHGVAVDGEGKVWLQPFSNTVWVDPQSGDTVRDNSGAPVSTTEIFVYNDDGTEAMDPIRTITVDAVTDTLTGNVRGLRTDHNGDILVASGAAELWRVDHTTGEGIDKVVVGSGPLSAPGVTEDGTIYTAFVIPGSPIGIYNSDFAFQANAVDSSRGFSRSFDVTADGNQIFWAGYSNLAIYRYTRPDEFSAFGDADTLLPGIVSESITRNPFTGAMWLSNGPAAGANPDSTFGDPSQYLTWYAFDPVDEVIVDSLKFHLDNPVGDEKPRGLAFSPDGSTAYAVIFDTNGNTSVRKIQGPDYTSIEEVAGEIPSRLELGRNYPNPFSGETTFEFAIADAGKARLSVFDVRGREVAVLVDDFLAAGRYSATFEAGNLAAGAYFYRLDLEGQRISGKMLLVK